MKQNFSTSKEDQQCLLTPSRGRVRWLAWKIVGYGTEKWLCGISGKLTDGVGFHYGPTWWLSVNHSNHYCYIFGTFGMYKIKIYLSIWLGKLLGTVQKNDYVAFQESWQMVLVFIVAQLSNNSQNGNYLKGCPVQPVVVEGGWFELDVVKLECLAKFSYLVDMLITRFVGGSSMYFWLILTIFRKAIQTWGVERHQRGVKPPTLRQIEHWRRWREHLELECYHPELSSRIDLDSPMCDIAC